MKKIPFLLWFLTFPILIGCKQQPLTHLNSEQDTEDGRVVPINKPTNLVEYYKDYYITEELESPKNILASANTLLQQVNQQDKKHWELTDSGTLFYQAKCNVPLTASWKKKLRDYYVKGLSDFWTITVECKEAGNNGSRQWWVDFQTNRPNGLRTKDFLDDEKNVKTYVQEDLGNENNEGLKHINDKAVKLINAYNQEHHTDFISLEPDARVWVEKCAVPQIVTWLDPSRDEEYRLTDNLLNRWYVQVSCSKTVAFQGYPNGTSWRVVVPTTREIFPTPTFKDFIANPDTF